MHGEFAHGIDHATADVYRKTCTVTTDDGWSYDVTFHILDGQNGKRKCGGGGGGTFFVLYKIGKNNPKYVVNSKQYHSIKLQNNNSSCNDNNSNHDCNIVDIALIIAGGGNGAHWAKGDESKWNGMNASSTDTCINRYTRSSCDFVSTGIYDRYDAGRDGSFKNDFDTFKSSVSQLTDFNECNPLSFLDGAIGGPGYVNKLSDYIGCDGGFWGGRRI